MTSDMVHLWKIIGWHVGSIYGLAISKYIPQLWSLVVFLAESYCSHNFVNQNSLMTQQQTHCPCNLIHYWFRLLESCVCSWWWKKWWSGLSSRTCQVTVSVRLDSIIPDSLSYFLLFHLMEISSVSVQSEQSLKHQICYVALITVRVKLKLINWLKKKYDNHGNNPGLLWPLIDGLQSVIEKEPTPYLQS